MEMIRAGGYAEGFHMRGSDVDQMYVEKLTKLVAEIHKQFSTYIAVVGLLKTSDVPLAFVKFVVLTPNTLLMLIRKSTQRIVGDYLSRAKRL